MKFLEPDLGWWIAGAILVLAVVRWRARWRYAATTASRVIARSRIQASPVRRLPFVLLAAALAFVALALMQPVIPYSQADVHSRGLDIVLLLDLSSSMQEEMDAKAAARRATMPMPQGKTRLEAVKQAIRTFVRGRRDDRIGLIVFSDNAYVVSPLTFDHEYLQHYIDIVDDQILRGEGQTAIGDGLALADYMLARQATRESRGHQVIVLFTDGENNRGREPVDVLKEAYDADIRVHVVGVDIEQEVQEKPAVQALIQTIERNGGKYFNANSERELQEASRTIDAIEKGLLVSRVYVRDVPVYQWFAIPALLALAVAMGLRAIPYFVDLT